MAFSDYHPCDNCGQRKTFYDADMTGIVWFDGADGHYRYNWAQGGSDYPAYPGYRIYSLCHECEKTHEVVIRARDSDGSGEAGETGTGSTEGDSAGRETASPDQDRITQLEADRAELLEAVNLALQCTPANTNFYDCGDPFKILMNAIASIEGDRS